jgi:formamidopyrimidine-DNA glycosylase
MPELPEVETVRSGLAKYVIGKQIIGAQSFHPRAVKSTSIAPLSTLKGVKIHDIKRRGKFLWFEFNREFVLVAHLGMSGQLLVQSSNLEVSTHLRAKLEISSQKKITKDEIRFIDQRTFGWLSIEGSKSGVPTSVTDIALDPFETNFDLKKVIQNIKRRKCAIKLALLNQNIISGIGNIYADEALWRSKIHPEIVCEDLTEVEIKNLIYAAKSVIRSAIKAGGTSFDEQYKNVNGKSGYFSRSLQVYGREGDKCSRCGFIIRRIAFTNRSSHFCPRCQR